MLNSTKDDVLLSVCSQLISFFFLLFLSYFSFFPLFLSFPHFHKSPREWSIDWRAPSSFWSSCVSLSSFVSVVVCISLWSFSHSASSSLLQSSHIRQWSLCVSVVVCSHTDLIVLCVSLLSTVQEQQSSQVLQLNFLGPRLSVVCKRVLFFFTVHNKVQMI